MTLIVSMIAQDVVFQVSDRRVTMIEADGSRTTRDEPATKAVVFCNRAVFGYTGHAVVDRKPTNDWIADQLKDVEDLGEGFDRMRGRLNRIWERRWYRRSGVGVTITASGFKLEPDGSTTPYYAVVSNEIKDGQWVTEPRNRFEWHVSTAPPNVMAIFASPIGWLSAERRQRLWTDVHSAPSLDAAIGAVAESIREVAADHMEVGNDLMVSVLPQSTVRDNPSTVLTGGPPGDGSPTFHYLPSDGDPVVYGPTYVCGGSVMTDFTVGPITPEILAELPDAE